MRIEARTHFCFVVGSPAEPVHRFGAAGLELINYWNRQWSFETILIFSAGYFQCNSKCFLLLDFRTVIKLKSNTSSTRFFNYDTV